MTKGYRSETLQEAENQLINIPITSGILGRQLALARSTIALVDEKLESGSLDVYDASYGLFVSYFAHQKNGNLDFDATGTFGHVAITVGGDLASEYGLTTREYWPCYERALREGSFSLLIQSGLIDDRFRDEAAWPNPISSN